MNFNSQFIFVEDWFVLLPTKLIVTECASVLKKLDTEINNRVEQGVFNPNTWIWGVSPF
jgi:hypothetical protein